MTLKRVAPLVSTYLDLSMVMVNSQATAISAFLEPGEQSENRKEFEMLRYVPDKMREIKFSSRLRIEDIT